MTPAVTKNHKKNIDKLSQIELTRLYRFAPSGHPYFSSDTGLYPYFTERFKELGGMTPSVSKQIGWRA